MNLLSFTITSTILLRSTRALTTKEAFQNKYYNGEEPPITTHDALGKKWLPESELVNLWNGTYVERIEDNISIEEFRKRFIDTQTPVVLSGFEHGGFGDVRNEETSSKWTWSYIRQMYGHVEAEYKFSSRHYGQDCAYNNLCPVGRISLKELIDKYIDVEDNGKKWQTDIQRRIQEDNEDVVVPYLRDLPLSEHFYELDEEVKFPQHFHEDLLAPFAETSWPTAFIAPGGTRSELHNDYGGSSFTMTPMLGRKSFILFPQADQAALESCYDEHYDGPAEEMETIVDPWNPDFDKCSNIVSSGVSASFTTLYPGDVLFVPASWMHAVRNFEPCVGITRNFINTHHLEKVQSNLKNQATGGEKVSDWILAALLDLASKIQPFEKKMDSITNNKPLMNRSELQRWNRERVLKLLKENEDLRNDVEKGLGIIYTRETVKDVAMALGFKPLEGSDATLSSLATVDLLDTDNWRTSEKDDEGEPLSKAFDSNTLYDFFMEMERRKRVFDNRMKRRHWSGETSTSHPSDTDNEFKDALGIEWLNDDQVVEVWNGTWIDVVTDITPEEFHNQYVIPQVPVVLRGAGLGGFGSDKEIMSRWSWSMFREKYGDISHEIKWSSRHYDQDCDIGLLCPIGEISMKDLIDNYVMREGWQEELQAMEDKPDTVPYLRDLSLEQYFPDLYDEVKFTSLVWENLLGIQHSHWPTAFFGPAGSRSELHHDYGGTAFTMTPLFGRKTFAIFPFTDEKLIMNCDGPEPIIDVFNPNFELCPDAPHAHLYYTTLHPGDTLYMPPMFMHAIRNPDASVGITRNFITLNELSSTEENLSHEKWDEVNEDDHPDVRYEGLDFTLAIAWEMALLLNESPAYHAQRMSIPNAFELKNREEMKDINREWVEHAMEEDEDLAEALMSGLPLFALLTYKELFDYVDVDPEVYDHDNASSEYAYEILSNLGVVHQYLNLPMDSPEIAKVLSFVDERKMAFAGAFAARMEFYRNYEEGEWEGNEEEEYSDGKIQDLSVDRDLQENCGGPKCPDAVIHA